MSKAWSLLNSSTVVSRLLESKVDTIAKRSSKVWDIDSYVERQYK